jgi:hypothetical protein
MHKFFILSAFVWMLFGTAVCGEEFTLKTRKMMQDIVGDTTAFPKYTTQLMNLANQNAHATRPKVVGQLSELIQQCPADDYAGWVGWYTRQHPQQLETAAIKIMNMLEKLKTALEQIDQDMVQAWVNDLVLAKTYVGLHVQESILKQIAADQNTPWRLARPDEESQGIDGYIGHQAVSVKPASYRGKPMLMENIAVPIIYYQKIRGGIRVSYDPW